MRQPTTKGENPVEGIGYNASIKDDRILLVTHHGLGPISSAVAGPNAKVIYDKKFYINTFKQKNI